MKSFLLLLLLVLLSLSVSTSTSTTQAFVATPIYSRGTSTGISTIQEAPRLFVSLSTPAYNSPSSSEKSTRSSLPWDWKPVVEAVFEHDQRPVILFDGVCNLCNGGVNFALDNDKQGNFRFASLQSKIGQSLLVSAGRRPNDMSSIVLVRANGRSYFESDAILRISAGLDGRLFTGIGKVGKFVPRMIRDALYHVVSENRHLLGESDQCRLDFDGEFDDRFMVEEEGL